MTLRPLPEDIRLARVNARRLFHRAMGRGAIVVRVLCQRCGRRSVGPKNGLDGVEAHHPDYSQPYNVTWLCHWCHMTADDQMRQALRALPEPSPSCEPNQPPQPFHAQQCAIPHTSSISPFSGQIGS